MLGQLVRLLELLVAPIAKLNHSAEEVVAVDEAGGWWSHAECERIHTRQVEVGSGYGVAVDEAVGAVGVARGKLR
jgi:hypothetical protein